jgi:hypothetical protein
VKTPRNSARSNNLTSTQTPPASTLYSKVRRPRQTSNSDYREPSLGKTVQQGGVIQSQGPPERPYNALVTQSQDSSFHSSNAGNSKQMSASDPIRVLIITTSEGSFDIPVDVHQASRLADEKRARNAGASARFRLRRKEKEKEANNTIEKLHTQTRELERRYKELELERDFYRNERDRLRDVVFRTPGLRHHAMGGPPSPQSMRSTSFKDS